MRDAFLNYQHLSMISLDTEIAYDVVWKNRIINSLMTNNIAGNMLAFIYNFLQRRRIQVRTNGLLSEQTEIQNGVPQGSVLSATLFLAAINDTADNITAPVQYCTSLAM
jgi:hypothetical protein